jgi:hypothetical protein
MMFNNEYHPFWYFAMHVLLSVSLIVRRETEILPIKNIVWFGFVPFLHEKLLIPAWHNH